MAPCLLGIDLGASRLKVLAIDPDGATLAQASAPLATASPAPGWAEQDPEQWWTALRTALDPLLASEALAAHEMAAIGITAGAHIAVLEDRHGRVIRPAILWSDQRSAEEAAALDRQAGAEIVAASLNRANATWTLCHLAWLRRHEPAALAACRRLYLAKDFLRARLTGDWTTDFSDALGALLVDAAARDWSEALCALAGLPRACLPPIADPTAIAGRVTAAAAAATGLPAGTPVVVGANDTTAELYGCGALMPGQGALKLATAGVVLLTTAGPEVHPPVSCYPHIIDGRWYMAAGINACASAHRWLRERCFAELAEAEAVAAMDAAAAATPPGAEGLLCHPYLLGERAPHWDAKLRGGFTGLTLRHERGHLVRALYEGIGFALLDVLRQAESLSGAAFGELRLLGGGAQSALWRQILADILERELVWPRHGDAAYGAALLAGVGAGLWPDKASAAGQGNPIIARHAPDPASTARYRSLHALFDETRRLLTPVHHRLHDLAQATDPPRADSSSS